MYQIWIADAGKNCISSEVPLTLRPGGLIVISMADLDSSSWKMMEAGRLNPYWVELERYHNFGRQRLVTLLQDCGFDVVDFAIPNRYKAQMEIYALRK